MIKVFPFRNSPKNQNQSYSIDHDFSIVLKGKKYPVLNSPKNQDQSYRVDHDFWIVLEGKNLDLITEEIW